MRDLIVFLLFVGLLPMCFLRPWVGVLVFSWLAYNRTQDLTWGFARELPISQLVAIAMIAGWMTWEYRPLLGDDRRLRAMVLLIVLIGMSLALNTVRWEWQGERYIELIKVVFVALLTAALMIDRRRLRQLMLVIALSLGFYGIKNGIWYLAGRGTIVGPGGMLKDNNDFALAMVMNLPFLWYMASEVGEQRGGALLKTGLRWAFVMTMLTIAATGSRGGFLAMGAVLLAMAMKTRWKVPALVGVAVVGVVGLMLAPEEYTSRLSTITAQEGQMDASIAGRLISWQVALNMIESNPLFGIGFNNMVFDYHQYMSGIWIPEGTKELPGRVAHNSYLQMAAESGMLAFVVYVFMIGSTILFLRRLSRALRDTEDAWIVRYSNAVEVSLYGFVVGATFLNRAHFDLVYQLVAVAVTLPVAVLAERRARAPRGRRGLAAPGDVWVRHRDPFVRIEGT